MKTQIESIVSAYRSGVASGNKLAIGRRFFGSMPISARLYGKQSAEYDAFMMGYHHAIDKVDIYVNGGKVTKLVLKGE